MECTMCKFHYRLEILDPLVHHQGLQSKCPLDLGHVVRACRQYPSARADVLLYPYTQEFNGIKMRSFPETWCPAFNYSFHSFLCTVCGTVNVVSRC
mmetsp:Transcript_16971/g.32046  ORF Transcript_16971/g.32046 Transcript_16971/m.32046 type:complete len:96 (+) Transcript_16971:218-505(+)